MGRRAALERAGFYDPRLYIFGNERDLTARLLNLGYRVKMVPGIEVFHKAPFGMRKGRRSLYYHVRNFWIYAFKYLPWGAVFSVPFVLLARALGRGAKAGGEDMADAVGTIGLMDSIRSVRGGFLICVAGTLAGLWNLPYCIRRRQVCRAEDFEPPLR